MVYTTNFKLLSVLPQEVVPIAICLHPPKWYKGLHYTKLAPSKNLFLGYKNRSISLSEFGDRFRKYLDSIVFLDVVSELFDIAKTTEIALVCYENEEVFCHRHIVSEWFREHYFPCKEF